MGPTKRTRPGPVIPSLSTPTTNALFRPSMSHVLAPKLLALGWNLSVRHTPRAVAPSLQHIRCCWRPTCTHGRQRADGVPGEDCTVTHRLGLTSGWRALCAPGFSITAARTHTHKHVTDRHSRSAAEQSYQLRAAAHGGTRPQKRLLLLGSVPNAVPPVTAVQLDVWCSIVQRRSLQCRKHPEPRSRGPETQASCTGFACCLQRHAVRMRAIRNASPDHLHPTHPQPSSDSSLRVLQCAQEAYKPRF